MAIQRPAFSLAWMYGLCCPDVSSNRPAAHADRMHRTGSCPERIDGLRSVICAMLLFAGGVGSAWRMIAPLMLAVLLCVALRNQSLIDVASSSSPMHHDGVTLGACVLLMAAVRASGGASAVLRFGLLVQTDHLPSRWFLSVSLTGWRAGGRSGLPQWSHDKQRCVHLRLRSRSAALANHKRTREKARKQGLFAPAANTGDCDAPRSRERGP